MDIQYTRQGPFSSKSIMPYSIDISEINQSDVQISLYSTETDLIENVGIGPWTEID